MIRPRLSFPNKTKGQKEREWKRREGGEKRRSKRRARWELCVRPRRTRPGGTKKGTGGVRFKRAVLTEHLVNC